jgi:hypothetical protein
MSNRSGHRRDASSAIERSQESNADESVSGIERALRSVEAMRALVAKAMYRLAYS